VCTVDLVGIGYMYIGRGLVIWSKDVSVCVQGVARGS